MAEAVVKKSVWPVKESYRFQCSSERSKMQEAKRLSISRCTRDGPLKLWMVMIMRLIHKVGT